MKNNIETAIKALAAKLGKDVGALEALQYSQAVLNLSNARRAIENEG